MMMTVHSCYMPKPAQLSLQEEVLVRSDPSHIKQLSVWYFMPPTDAKDALQTTDVECLDGLDVTSVGGPRLTIVQQNRYTYLVDSNLCKNGKVAIKKNLMRQFADNQNRNYQMTKLIRGNTISKMLEKYK